MTDVRLRTLPTADLSRAERDQVRAFLDAAFDGRFGDEDWAHALGGLHVLGTVDGELVGHAAVIGRQLIAGEATLHTGYVEAVATGTTHRRRGVAAAVMAETERLVAGGFELGALASSKQGIALYTARGWLRWPGELAALTPDGVVPTPDEVVFVRPTAATPAPLHTTGRLVCDWRRGDLW